MSTIQALRDRMKMDHPSASQLGAINKWKPYGQPDYDASEVLTVSILASDNLIRESLEVYSANTLRSMAATYPGESFMLNHSWGDVKEAIGFVYDAEILRVANVGNGLKQAILENSFNFAVDESLLNTEGYMAVICHCAIAADSTYASAIRYRQLSDVSTGGLAAANYVCPLCGGDFGEDDEHYPPGWWSSLLAAWGEIDEDDIAPYAILDSWHRSKELSFVTAGNVPRASILTEQLIKLVGI